MNFFLSGEKASIRAQNSLRRLFGDAGTLYNIEILGS